MTIFLSRYPGEAHVLPAPALAMTPVLSPDLVSIHEHALEPGRYLVVEWQRAADGRWLQLGTPVNVPSLVNAQQYVPPRSRPIPVPDGWAVEAWEP